METEILEASSEGTLTLQLTPAQLLNLVHQVEELKRAVLREGVDYGSPKRPDGRDAWPKPALYVSGAEKLLQAFGLSYRVEVTRRDEDPERGWWRYECTATIMRQRIGPDGTVMVVPLGSATAAANSREARWRNSDPWTLQDTILAMSEKRALVRATRRTLALSGLFAEEAPDEGGLPPDSRARRAAEQAVQASRRPRNAGPQPSDSPSPEPRSETDTGASDPWSVLRRHAGRLRLGREQVSQLMEAAGSQALDIGGLTEEQARSLVVALMGVPDGTSPETAVERVVAALSSGS